MLFYNLINSVSTMLNADAALTSIAEKFKAKFHSTPLLIKSPGRINLIGDHTDYNEGFVMPAAIDKHLLLAIGTSTEKYSTLYSLKYNESVKIDSQQLTNKTRAHWSDYMIGVLKQLSASGHYTKPFHCMVGGDLPSGAGLSSSAALECGFAFALDQLNQWCITTMDIIKLSQKVEHEWIGVRCGIMDQFTNMMGKKNHALVLDCRSLEQHYFPLELNDYTILLCDTGVKHSLASSAYNQRRKECETGVSILKQSGTDLRSLRDVTLAMLEAGRDRMEPTIYNRCAFVLAENKRVLDGSKNLEQGDAKAFGRKMFESHEGLSKLYDVSCAELDFLVEKAMDFQGIIGSRMMGGGFGGVTISLIAKDEVENFLSLVAPLYRSTFGLELKSYIVRTMDGTAVVQDDVRITK